MELKCLTHYNAPIKNIYHWMQIILHTPPTISSATMSDNISNMSKELFSQPTDSRTSSECRCHDNIGNLFNKQPIKHNFLFLGLSPSYVIQQQTMMKVVVRVLRPNYVSHWHNDIMICTDGQNNFFCADQAAQMSRAMRSRFFSQSIKVYLLYSTYCYHTLSPSTVSIHLTIY